MNEPTRLIDEPPSELVGELLRASADDPLPSRDSRMQTLVALGLATAATTAATGAAASAAASTAASIAPAAPAKAAAAAKVGGTAAQVGAASAVGKGAAAATAVGATAKFGGALTAIKIATAITVASAGVWTARKVSMPPPSDMQTTVAPKVLAPVRSARRKAVARNVAANIDATSEGDSDPNGTSAKGNVDAPGVDKESHASETRGQKKALSGARAANSAVAEEIAAIDHARKTMASDPAAALKALKEYEAKNPRGRFAAESAFLRIQALREQGRHDEAARAAQAFRARFPNSPLNARLK